MKAQTPNARGQGQAGFLHSLQVEFGMWVLTGRALQHPEP